MILPLTHKLSKRAVVMACAIATALPGCTLLGRRVRECEGFDVPLSVFVGPSRKELRTRVLASGIDETFPFVAETNAESMVIVGFTPLGTKSFTLTRKADEVEVDNILGARQKVSPRNVMADVLAMSLPSPCATAADGDVPSNFDSWRVVDTCSDNRPLKRTIAKASGETPVVEVEIEYRPEAIVVRQKQCRYTAAYVLQVSAPIPGVDVKKSDASAEAAVPAATAPAAAPAPEAPATTPAAPAIAPAPSATPAAPATAPAPAATPAAPSAPPSAAPARPASPPAATKPSGMLVPSPAGSPVLVPAN